MKLNQFLHLMNSIEEVMENDDVDIVVVGKDSGEGDDNESLKRDTIRIQT